jgi:thioredoxin reductase
VGDGSILNRNKLSNRIESQIPSTINDTMAASQDQIVDVLIIGGNHAGLSAALTLYRAMHTTVIFDAKKPRNHYSTPVRLTPTMEHKSPGQVKAESRKELEDAGFTTFVDSKIVSMEKRDDGLFEAVDANGAKWIGRKVLFATGAKDIFPAVEGYEELYTKAM